MKPISTKQHGVVDYVFAASTYAIARALSPRERTRKLLTGSSLAVVAMSAMTDYELGPVRALPMKAHLALDLVLGSLFVAAPVVLRDEETRVKASVAALGALGTAVAALTKS